ncbi:hypothetical protein J4E93_009765 [Alternaria ventricosa]|uniref:uncharacterized protein n=1 Tax=Alternaria ventricosa TaxID=1187951 RepID=UPI0020C1C13B|nr:uncharacterized protein J4E93_009765 [Alternaria ventricosa]KAI4638737.1 hypothetical protein J4E93_009765 [Alternaria ventricosa]
MAHPSASSQDGDTNTTTKDTSRPPHQPRNGSRATPAPDTDAVQPTGPRRQVTTPTTSAVSFIKSSTTEVDALSGAAAAIEATSAQHRPSRESKQSEQLYKDDPDMYDNSRHDGRGPTVNEPVYGVFHDRPIDRQAYINGAEVVQIRLTVAVQIIGEIQPGSWARLDTFSKEQGEESVEEVYRQFPEIRQQAAQQASLNRSTNVERQQQDQQRVNNVAGPFQGVQEIETALHLAADHVPHYKTSPAAPRKHRELDRRRADPVPIKSSTCTETITIETQLVLQAIRVGDQQWLMTMCGLMRATPLLFLDKTTLFAGTILDV